MDRPSPSALNRLRMHHLKLVEVLNDVGSLHKAATVLHVSQPRASAMLNEVERALGKRLFERTRKGVLLNQDGLVAVTRLRSILQEFGMLSQEFEAARPLPVVRVGALNHAFFGLLQRSVPAFLSRADCRLKLVDGAAAEVLDSFLAGRLDCVIGRPPVAWAASSRREDFFYQLLYDIELCVFAASSHPLARKRRLELQDLAQYRWILPREGSHIRNALTAAFATAGLADPEIQVEVSSFLFALPLLTGGRCLTIAPRDAGGDCERRGIAKILPIKIAELTSPVVFAAKRSAMANPNLRTFWEEVRKAIPR